VPLRVLGEAGWNKLFAMLSPGGVLIDVKSVLGGDRVPPDVYYWSL
jgi:hypothetical protein